MAMFLLTKERIYLSKVDMMLSIYLLQNRLSIAKHSLNIAHVTPWQFALISISLRGEHDQELFLSNQIICCLYGAVKKIIRLQNKSDIRRQ